MVISGANSSSGGATNNRKSFSPEGISTCISEITECAKELYNCNTNINDCFASINNTLNIMGKGNSETTNFDNEISKIKYISRWLQTALDNYNKLMGNYTNETTDYTKNIGSNLTALSSNATTSRTTKKASSYSGISSGYSSNLSSNSSSYSGNESSSSSSSSTTSSSYVKPNISNTVAIASGDGRCYYNKAGELIAKNEAVSTDSETGVTNAAWDFTDWDFVEEARAAATSDGSDTDYYVYVSWEEPCRVVILHRDSSSSDWYAIGGWYAGVGRRRSSDGVPRGCAGTFTITQRWWDSDTGPGRCMDYIECYNDGYPEAYGNNSASFHSGMGDNPGKWGYTTHSCISLTGARAEWMYNNIPLGTRMRNVGSMYGYDNADDSNLNDSESYDIEINNPFA